MMPRAIIQHVRAAKEDLAHHRRRHDIVGLPRRKHRVVATGAVRAGTCHDHRETVAMLFGQRPKEQVDRRALAARLVEFRSRDFMIGDMQAPVG